ncbi:hypothetical protein AA313_de0203927 [Arthrobotrys entomopaga]|nr:hypothetical protein AA313_de0203927 [Arthrobotrys entomopaga]
MGGAFGSSFISCFFKVTERPKGSFVGLPRLRFAGVPSAFMYPSRFRNWVIRGFVRSSSIGDSDLWRRRCCCLEDDEDAEEEEDDLGGSLSLYSGSSEWGDGGAVIIVFWGSGEIDIKLPCLCPRCWVFMIGKVVGADALGEWCSSFRFLLAGSLPFFLPLLSGLPLLGFLPLDDFFSRFEGVKVGCVM